MIELPDTMSSEAIIDDCISSDNIVDDCSWSDSIVDDCSWSDNIADDCSCSTMPVGALTFIQLILPYTVTPSLSN